jgi:ABC-type Fe3+/spermidine/putrescine transport system ATPase subunit
MTRKRRCRCRIASWCSNKGRTQQVAAPTEAYLKPANRFVAEFLGIANFVGLPDGRTGRGAPEAQVAAAGGRAGQAGKRVVEAIYLGQMVRYHLALGRQSIVSGGAVRRHILRAGERVSVSWESADIWPVT